MNRHHNFYFFSKELSLLSDTEIKEIISTKNIQTTKKWGINKIYKVQNKKTFLKAIPVAKLYSDNPFDTSNLYNVPSYYNYGFGSAGVNPWRELILHIMTTNLVLSDKCENFPLLYHYRIIKDNDNKNIESGMSEKLMKRWNDNKNIKKYLEDRINAEYKIVLFLEFIPYVAYEYLNKHIDFMKDFYEKTTNIIKYCNKNGIFHNDAHLGNYLIDKNKNVYLTDFGLSLSLDFKLDSNEKKFIKNNNMLDIYYTIDNVASEYVNRCFYDKNIKKIYNLNKFDSTITLYTYIFDNIDLIKNNEHLSKFQLDFIKNNKVNILKFITWKREFKNIKNKEKYNLKKLKISNN